MDLKLKVRKTIEEHNLISSGDRVVLGFSGGPDSLCLLSILNDLKKVFDFSLCALHVNHSIRGDEADGDAQFAKDFCEENGIEFILVKEDVPQIAKALGKSEEEAGREVRIRALKNTAADKIALAHNKDDQAETVLMRILRGTGTRGLCGMEYKRADGVIRPSLDAEKSEILDYCKRKNLSPRIDRTNLETDYTRNKIRLELLPEIKNNFNPNITEALVRLSENASDDEAFLDEIARNSMTRDIKKLAQMSNAIFKRVVVLLFAEEGLTEDISAVHINSLRSVVLKNVGGKVVEFPHGYTATVKKGKLLIEKVK